MTPIFETELSIQDNPDPYKCCIAGGITICNIKEDEEGIKFLVCDPRDDEWRYLPSKYFTNPKGFKPINYSYNLNDIENAIRYSTTSYSSASATSNNKDKEYFKVMCWTGLVLGLCYSNVLMWIADLIKSVI